jgi:hypothetical protein
MYRFFPGLALSIVVLGLMWAAQSTTLERPRVRSNASETSVQLTTAGEMLVTAEWFDLIFNETRKRSDAELERSVRQGGDRRNSIGGTYRTLCVRLCDGFHFPVSDSTRRERFSGDAKQCEQRCPARSRLFVHPWDEAALARHRTYAEDVRKKVPGRTADLASPDTSPRGQLQSARRE